MAKKVGHGGVCGCLCVDWVPGSGVVLWSRFLTLGSGVGFYLWRRPIVGQTV